MMPPDIDTRLKEIKERDSVMDIAPNVDYADVWKDRRWLLSLVDSLRTIIAQHDLCHDLHGKVGAREFADGCADEQRKHYGCALDADEVIALRAELAELKARHDTTKFFLKKADDEIDRLDSEIKRLRQSPPAEQKGEFNPGRCGYCDSLGYRCVQCATRPVADGGRDD